MLRQFDLKRVTRGFFFSFFEFESSFLNQDSRIQDSKNEIHQRKTTKNSLINQKRENQKNHGASEIGAKN